MNTLLPHWTVYRATGNDAAEFFHRQLSNDILHLKNQAAWALYNTPQGRVIADLLLIPEGDSWLIVLADDLADCVMMRLKKFVMRAQVTWEKLETWAVAVDMSHVSEQLPDEVPLSLDIQNQKIGVKVVQADGSIWQIAPRENLPSYDQQIEYQWRQMQMHSGRLYITQNNSEKWVAQMLNLHQLGAVHFNKGCYPGQEIIARVQYRGAVKRGLILAQISGDALIGEDILADEKSSCGEVVALLQNSSGSLLLCVVSHESVRQSLSVRHQSLSIKKIFFDRE